MKIFDDIKAELERARSKFPAPNPSFTALVEEVGEVAQALMHHSLGKSTAEEVYAEAVQVAVMAIRLAEEGSSEHPNYKGIKNEYESA